MTSSNNETNAPQTQSVRSEEVHHALIGDNTEWIGTRGKWNNIERKSLKTLLGNEKLDDGVINCYFDGLRDRSKVDGNQVTIHCFSSFFSLSWSSDIAQKWRQTAVFPEGIAKWTKRGDQSLNLFQKHALLIPWNYDNEHWALVAAFPLLNRIIYLDSLRRDGTEARSRVLSYLEAEYQDKQSTKLATANWTSFDEKNVPEQTDPFNCGVFVCQMAERVSKGLGFDFSQADMPRLREEMLSQIVAGKIPILPQIRDALEQRERNRKLHATNRKSVEEIAKLKKELAYSKQLLKEQQQATLLQFSEAQFHFSKQIQDFQRQRTQLMIELADLRRLHDEGTNAPPLSSPAPSSSDDASTRPKTPHPENTSNQATSLNPMFNDLIPTLLSPPNGANAVPADRHAAPNPRRQLFPKSSENDESRKKQMRE